MTDDAPCLSRPIVIENLLSRPRNRRAVSYSRRLAVGAWTADIPGTLLSAIHVAVCTRCDLDGGLALPDRRAARPNTSVVVVVLPSGVAVAERIVWQLARGEAAVLTPDEEASVITYIAPAHRLLIDARWAVAAGLPGELPN